VQYGSGNSTQKYLIYRKVKLSLSAEKQTQLDRAIDVG